VSLAKVKSKKVWSDRGVSEVVGTILILAITVVLFSSIMVFVMNMPMPSNTPVADFRASIDVSGNVATLSILHNGGETLFDYATKILVKNGQAMQSFYIRDNITQPASNIVWQIGQIWTFNMNKRFTSPNLVNTSSKLEVDIIDVESNSMIWSSMVGTGSGSNIPVILQRWADGNVTTLTVDPIVPSTYAGFSVYVRVTDNDGYTSSLPASGKLYTGASTTDGVWLDVSSITGMTHPKLRDNYSNGVWRFDFPKFSDPKTYDGKPLIIHANNSANTVEVKETYILTVQQPDVSTTNTNYNTDITYNGTEPNNEAGLPSYLKWFDADQGYVILSAIMKSGQPTGPNLTDSRSTFKQGEYVYVRVGSFKLQNIFAGNSLSLVDRQSGVTIYPTGNQTPFYRVPQSGGVFVYQTNFSTATLLGGYDMSIDLQSTVTSGNSLISFNAVGNLVVQPVSGAPLLLPEVRVNGTSPLNTSSAVMLGDFTAPFDLSDASKSVIWVDLIFLDAGRGSDLTVGNVEIRDLRDRTVLSGVPPASKSLNSTFGKVYSDKGSATSRNYVFKIDLRLKNGYNLVPGTATYTLTISNAFDTNEGVYTISIPIWIKSATETKNYIVATSGFGGGGNFNDISYLFQIENNKFFTTRILEKVAMTPSTSYTDIQTYRVIYFDIDGDGDRDAVASMNTPAGYGWGVYVNRMNEYGIWEPKSFYLDPGSRKITALAYGDVNLDGSLDFITANSSGGINLYLNTFPVVTRVPYTIPEITGKYALEMRLADMTGDGKADLIVLVGTVERTTAVVGQIYIYDFSSGAAVKLTDVSALATVADFDVADINNDGLNDYAIVSSVNGIGWYRAVPTNSNYLADSDIPVPPTVVVPNPNGYLNTQSVGVADEQIQESGGSATHIWRTQVLAGSNPTLRIDAKVSAGCTEAFYFYYSTNSAGPWTYMFYVPQGTTGSYQSFTYKLRLGLTGPIYLKVTDANSGDSSTNSIYIDFIQVTTTSKMGFLTWTQWVADNTYKAIGVGNFNGDTQLDATVAKDGRIQIVNGLTGAIISSIVNADIRAGGDTFNAKDVNGDGLADIVYVLNYVQIASPSYDTSAIVQEWLNTLGGATGTDIQIKHLPQNYGASASGKNQNYGPQIFGAINCIAVENPYG
jgi:flagellin-like protein